MDKPHIPEVEPQPTPQMTDDQIIDAAASRIMELYREAFEELAK